MTMPMTAQISIAASSTSAMLGEGRVAADQLEHRCGAM